MKRFSERNPVALGVVGTVVAVLALAAAFSYQQLTTVFDSGRSYHAIFAESGGLSSDAEVQTAGVKVGSVTGVTLHHGRVQVDFRITDDGARFGRDTTAHIVTLTVLGKRGLRLDSAGPGALAGGSTIPLSRTIAPYDLTDALSGLTQTTSDIDTANLTKALSTLSATFQNTPANVKASVAGLSRLSETFASRDAAITTLLAASNNVSGVLAKRSNQVTTLLGDGTTLLAAVNARRTAITSLLAQVSAVSKQLRGLVADNRSQLKPTLTKLTAVTTLLNRNQNNLDQILDRVGPFAGSLGESVGSGPFFSAYVQNLTKPVDLAGLDTSPLCPLLGCTP